MRASLTTCALVITSPPSTTKPLPEARWVGKASQGAYQLPRCE
jgi:hypothetical protein